MQRKQTGITLPKATSTPLLMATQAIELVPGNEALLAPVDHSSFVKVGRDDAAAVLPKNIDGAYELGFLRAGGKEVLRLHLFDLLQRGHLTIVDVKGWFSTTSKLARAENPPPNSELTILERGLVDWFASPRQAIYANACPEALKSACEAYRERLERQELLRPLWPARAIPIAAGIVTFAVLASLVKFPVALVIAGFVGALTGGALSKFTRLTHAGRLYLDKVQARFEPIKDRAVAARLDEPDPALIWGVAAFGLTILAGSSYDAFAVAMVPAGSNGFVVVGGWWGGDTCCGGSGCGSDCDGGCGGCGGCGD